VGKHIIEFLLGFAGLFDYSNWTWSVFVTMMYIVCCYYLTHFIPYIFANMCVRRHVLSYLESLM